VKAIDHTVWERVVNTLGRVVRVPGRALITGDEFFKAVNRNAEISVQAFRQADEEALARNLDYGTDAYEAFVTRRTQKLSDVNIKDTENIRIQEIAKDKARLVTFQENPRTNFGGKAEALVNSNVWFKLVFAPFFRTPMNILRQGIFDRTPLGRTLDHTKDILQNAHPRDQSEMQARMLTGMGAMGAFMLSMTTDEEGSGFQVVGKVPYGTSAKVMNVSDYSIRLGDKWYQFNRLEPFGMWLGIVADLKTAAKYSHSGDEEDYTFGLGQAALASFMNNVTGKTFMTSFKDFQDLSDSMATGRQSTVKRGVAQFAAGQFGKLVPQLFKGAAAGLEGDGERYAQEAWTLLDVMAARSSVFNSDLRDKHDALGRPIPRDSGLSILANPFSVSQHSDDPVDKEMFRLGFQIQPMQKSLGGGAFELTAAEYSTMTGLVADTGIHETLTALVTSEAWAGLNDHLKMALMKQQITESRAAARMMLLGTGDIAERAAQKQIDAAFLLTDED